MGLQCGRDPVNPVNYQQQSPSTAARVLQRFAEFSLSMPVLENELFDWIICE